MVIYFLATKDLQMMDIYEIVVFANEYYHHMGTKVFHFMEYLLVTILCCSRFKLLIISINKINWAIQHFKHRYISQTSKMCPYGWSKKYAAKTLNTISM